MNNLVNLVKAFKVQCPFVQSQISGIRVRSPIDEHVRVCSMFDKMVFDPSLLIKSFRILPTFMQLVEPLSSWKFII